MNFLAHAFLARGDDEWIIGSMIADFRPYPRNLPDGVLQGIELHRVIDSYVDKSAEFGVIRSRLRSEAGLFAPVVADICCDNLLIENWSRYSTHAVNEFTSSVYRAFRESGDYLPVPWKRASEDWLASYQSRQGLERSLLRVKNRLKSTRRFPDISATLDLFFKHQDELHAPFVRLFDELEVEAEKLKAIFQARS